jgi:hypothetical protein
VSAKTSLQMRREHREQYWKMVFRNASKSFINVGKSVSQPKATNYFEGNVV